MEKKKKLELLILETKQLNDSALKSNVYGEPLHTKYDILLTSYETNKNHIGVENINAFVRYFILKRKVENYNRK